MFGAPGNMQPSTRLYSPDPTRSRVRAGSVRQGRPLGCSRQPVFVVRLHKTWPARLPGRRGRRRCGQANERGIGLPVVTSHSRIVFIGARGEAPVGQPGK
jgi:hypothetical protein